MKLFELPKAELRYSPKKRSVSMPDLSGLKDGQRKAFEGIKEYLLDKEAVGSCFLDGAAGSGKSYLSAAIVEFILSYMRENKKPYYKIAVTATTNKAVKVTYRMATYYDSSIEYRTVHSLLGLKEKIGANGEQLFVQDYKSPPALSDYDLIFIDECSMLSNELFCGHSMLKGIQDYIEEGLKAILVGDPNQIPPVNAQQCPALTEEGRETYNIRHFVLDEIVRQAADNPIISLATRVRKHLHIPKSFAGSQDMLWEGDKGVYFIDRNDDNGLDDLEEILSHVFTSENFKQDPDFGKIIAYHRKAVYVMNNYIRQLIYGDEADTSRLLIGEKLIVDSPIMEPEDKKIMLPTNEELEVVEFTDKFEDVNDGQFRIPYHNTLVRYFRFDNSTVEKRIKIPTWDGQEIVDEILQTLAAHAKSLKGDKVGSARAWREFYDFKETFAEVSYNYSITGHRSQGSTYVNAFVMEYDIDKNPRIKERQRIKYTAFTRPSQRLFVIN